MATAGDLVFQGAGNQGFYALDARDGKVLFRYQDKRGVRASPLTYVVNGRQHIAVVVTNKIVAFALP
jgi:glucose dehydrogenase